MSIMVILTLGFLCSTQKILENEEKDDLKDLVGALGSALVLDPSKPVAMEAEISGEESGDEVCYVCHTSQTYCYYFVKYNMTTIVHCSWCFGAYKLNIIRIFDILKVIYKNKLPLSWYG